MGFVWISALKDFRRLRRDPFSVAAFLAIPLMLAVLMNLVFGREATPQGRLLVSDEDKTFLSNVLTGAFSREPLSKMLLVEQVGREQGRTRIDNGDASALLIIPQGFQDAYLNNRPFRLQLFTNPGQRILPRIVQETLSIVIEGSYYLQRVAGAQLRSFQTSQAPTDAAVARSSIAINQLITRLGKYLFPPLIQLDIAVTEEQKSPNFASLFFPGMIFMAFLFVSNALAQEIWKEHSAGTLRRLTATPAPLSAFLAGRLLVVASVLAIVAVVGLAAMRWLASVPVANLPAAAIWMVCAGSVFFLLLLLASLYASSARMAGVAGNLVVFPLALIGGCFFPFELMPEWMAAIGRRTPNGWAVSQFRAILAGSSHSKELAVAFLGLAIAGALAWFLSLRRMRRNFVA